MDAALRQRVEEVCAAALDRAPGERTAFVAAMCGHDDRLLREVQALLAESMETERFMAGVADAAAELIGQVPEPTVVGTDIGSYRVLSRIGGGGMGDVYECEDTRLGRVVAIKVLRPTVIAGRQRVWRMGREARLLASLNHPGICTIHEFGEYNGRPFMVMEFVDGVTLADRIAQPLPPDDIANIGIQIADALGAAHHKRIVHRDIKPTNVMITGHGRVKLLDFGIAKLSTPEIDTHDSTYRTQPGALIGTPHYMSPEQVLGRDVDHRSDLFSMGVVLYQMATGRLPFAGTSVVETIDQIIHSEPKAIHQWNPAVPSRLVEIIERCLKKKREDRYQTAQECLDDLRRRERRFARRGRHNLPVQLTSFVGRHEETLEIARIIPTVRLLTLTGPGGIGKTRLALQVAASALDDYTDGVWFVDLAPLQDASLVPGAVAAVLGIHESADVEWTEAICDCLRTARALIVLDNCEHVVSACADLCTALLRATASVSVLATSREPLSMSGESVRRVPPMMVPSPGAIKSGEDLLTSEAGALFVARGRSVDAAIHFSPRDAATVASICERLDGVPLAIELAAVRLKVLSVAEIHERLTNRLQLLAATKRDVAARHRTLRATIEWSHELLSHAERLLFRRLSVFAGGWTLAASESICAGEDLNASDVLDVLSSLVDKSLVMAEPGTGETRYRMLETIREFAHEQLLATGEHDACRRKHSDFFLRFAEAAAPELLGAQQAEWFRRVEVEYANLRVAMAAAAIEDDAGESGGCLRFVAALGRFWIIRGHVTEGSLWVSKALARADSPGQPVQRGRALEIAGDLATEQGDYATACSYYEELLSISQASGDEFGIGTAYLSLGHVRFRQGDHTEATACYEKSVTFFRRCGYKLGIAGCCGSLGNLAALRGDYSQAQTLRHESLTTYRELGAIEGVAIALQGMAEDAYAQCDWQGARTLLEESLTIFERVGSRKGVASVCLSLGDLASDVGNYPLAHSMFERARTSFTDLRNNAGIVRTRLRQGRLAARERDYPRAGSMFQEGLAVARGMQTKRWIGLALQGLGRIAAHEGDAKRSRALYEESLGLSRELGVQREAAQSLNGLGSAARLEQAYRSALVHHRRALEAFHSLDDKTGVAETLNFLAAASASAGLDTRAATLFGAATALFETIRLAPCPADLDLCGYTDCLARLRTSLGHRAFDEAWRDGRALSVDAAIRLGLEG
jgi:predicted ATPase